MVVEDHERKPRFIGPMNYLVAADLLINEGNDLLSFEELIRGLTLFLLKKNDSYSLTSSRLEVRRALGDHGLWGYTNVYWQHGSICLHKDTFGLGSKLDRTVADSTTKRPIVPSNPQRTVRHDPKMFGTFSPELFLSSPAGEFFGTSSQPLSKLAYRNGLDIMVRGTRVRPGELARTVCSIRFKDGRVDLNLAEDENSQHYALGRKTESYDRSRFTQP